MQIRGGSRVRGTPPADRIRLVLLFTCALLLIGIPATLGRTHRPVSPTMRPSPKSTLPKLPRNKHIKVAVCMVGQLARTEVRSKIDNLILANKRNSDLHMFLVMSTGKARFVNKATRGCEIAPTSLEDAETRFSEHVPTLVKEYKYKPYHVDIDKWPGYPEIGQVKKKRLQNHINQFRTWQICAKMIAKQEHKTRIKYHAVLRIRDNALVLQPFNILDRLLLLSQQVRSAMPSSEYGHGRLDLMDLPVLTKECSSWSGVNDKVMLIPRMHMDAALSAMAEEFYLVSDNETWPGTMGNPERYVKTMLETAGVPIFAEPDPQNFPITDGRCEDGKSFCVVNQRKDCRPVNTSFPVNECEELYINNGWDEKRLREEAAWMRAKKAEQGVQGTAEEDRSR